MFSSSVASITGFTFTELYDFETVDNTPLSKVVAYEYDSTKTYAEMGATIVNVYYSRNSYKLALDQPVNMKPVRTERLRATSASYLTL